MIKPGIYIDPFGNIAIRSYAGNWALWSVTSDDMTERFVHNPDPRSIDRLYIQINELTDSAKERLGIDPEMKFEYIGE